MIIKFPQLPYEESALEPIISRETLQYHYGKHYRGYFDKLTQLITGTELENKSLQEIIKCSEGAIFNNAAQVFNHTFYWHCMSPKKTEPTSNLLDAISKQFGSLENFKQKFSAAAASHFGSGWCWLVADEAGLSIETTENAGCPIKYGKKPLLTLDVWEHAYYIDYRNARVKYIERWCDLINWDFVAQNL